jgi:hypothetical protein
MFVEISHDWEPETMTLTATLAYYPEFEAEHPVHSDTLTFTLAALIGPVPSVQLHNPVRLRDELYDRVDTIDTRFTQLMTLKTLLDQLPEGARMRREQVLRMLEGALD